MGLQLSAQRRSPCAGRTPQRLDLRRQHGPRCPSHTACPFPVLQPTPWHRSSTMDHSNMEPSLGESPLQEPPHEPPARCVGLRQASLWVTSAQPCPPHSPATALAQQQGGAAALMSQKTSLKYHILLRQHWAVTSGRRPSRQPRSSSILNCP